MTTRESCPHGMPLCVCSLMTYVIKDDTFVLAKSTHMRAAPMESDSSRSSWSPTLWYPIRNPSQGSGQSEQAETPQGEDPLTPGHPPWTAGPCSRETLLGLPKVRTSSQNTPPSPTLAKRLYLAYISKNISAQASLCCCICFCYS